MGKESSNSKTPLLHSAFLYTYIAILIVSILAVVFLPEENKGIRNVAGFLIYGTGLPILIGLSLYFSEKKGWLVIGKKNKE